MSEFDAFIIETQMERDARMEAVIGKVSEDIRKMKSNNTEELVALMLKTSLAVYREEIRILFPYLLKQMRNDSPRWP